MSGSSRGRLWGFARNTASLLSSDVVTRATSFVVYALVGRRLGTLEFGQLLLAVSLFQLFGRLSGLGLRDLLTRTVAKDRDSTASVVGNATLLILAATAVAGALLAAVIWLLDYSEDTTRVILAIFVGLLPFGITRITEAVFIGWERTSRIAWVNIPVNLLQTGVAAWLIFGGYSVLWVSLSIGVAYLVMAVLQWTSLRSMLGPVKYDFGFGAARSLLVEALPFFGMDAAIALTSSATVLILSKFVDEVGVGTYSAATQLLVPAALITQTVATVLFPVMVRRARLGIERLRGTTVRAMEAMMLVAAPGVVIYFALGGFLLALVFGEDEGFEQSITIIQIVSVKPIEYGISAILGRTLLTLGRERTLLRIVVVRTLLSFGIATLLIWRFGLVGAAVASVIVGVVNVALHYVPVARSLSGLPILPALIVPTIGAGAMSIALALSGGLHDVVRAVIACVVYVAAVGVTILVSPGGFRRYTDLESAP